MARTISINIQTRADLKGIQSAQKALADLVKAGNKPSGGAAGGVAGAYTAQAKAANAAAQAAAKLAVADSRVAAAASNAATAAQRNAAATSNAATAHARAEKAALSFAAAQARAEQATTRANSGMTVLPRTIAGLSHEAASFAATSLTMGAAVGVAAAAVQSFADAFQFKAQLDATTLAINAQLKGVRESSAVWNEAGAFARTFKLTQEETTNAIAASIGVMRTSKAPIEDILGVLARMQVLSPEQSLQEAAIALKALASGDTTSLVTRFEVGRDVANQMKQEIQGGADAVAVMSQFLGDTGIGMDVLATKTAGAAGAIKDLAIAQEQLKVAQAEFAQGPGMTILEGQIRVTSGATRVLSGDFDAMGQSIKGTGVELIASAAAVAAYAAALANGATAAEAQAAADQAATAATQALTQAHTSGGGGSYAFAVATTVLTGAMSAESAAAAQLAAATQAATDAAAASAQQSLIDAAAKDEEAAKIALAAAQATVAVAAFMALHPNISASGVASLQAAGQITPLLSQLIQATLRAREAAQALASFNALQGVKATRVRPNEDRDAIAGMKHEAVEARRTATARVSAAQYAATKERTLAVGTNAQKIALLQNEHTAAVKMYGATSTQAYEAQTKILQAQTTGGAARVGAAGASASKLETIESNTGLKLASIIQDTQSKITAIAEREAARQAAALQKLNDGIATAAADRRASNEADDLSAVGVTDPQEAARINDRERAQADARKREADAAAEARATAAAGDAELAQKQLGIREKQIGDQQSLDESYYARQRELAADPAAQEELTKQYAEATRAYQERADTELAIAQAESAQKQQAVTAEKDAVIAAAEEQANAVVGAAQRSAAGVKNATAEARTAAVGNLTAIGDAVNAIPTSKTITITVKQDGSVGASTPTARAAGGDTNVGRVTLVGERGPELVVFDTPGRVYSADKTKSLFQAGSIPGLAAGGLIDAGSGYTTPIAGESSKKKKKGKKKGGGAQGNLVVDMKAQLDEQKNVVQLLKDLIDLRGQLEAAATQAPFNVDLIRALITRASEFVAMVRAQLIPITKADGEALKGYVDAAQSAISVISDVAGLREQLQENIDDQPFNVGLIYGLAQRAGEFLKIVQAQLVPMTEFDVELLNRYADAVGSVVGILGDVAGLREQLQENIDDQPFNMAMINQMATDAARIVGILQSRIVPTSEAQADAIGLYASAVGDSVSILSDVIALKDDLADGSNTPINMAMITRLADQAIRIATIVSGRLIPATEDQTKKLSAYADLVGSSVSVLKDVSDLSGKLFTDYVSPTDAQLGIFVADANRITAAFAAASAKYNTEGLEHAKLYAESVGAVFATVKDGLLAVDALNSGDFVLKGDALGTFATASLAILDTTQMLGARAAQIPAGDMAALQTATAVISGQAEAMIRMAAVPFGDLPNAAANLARQGGALLGGSGGATNIHNTFNLPAGSNQQTVDMVIHRLNQQMGARR